MQQENKNTFYEWLLHEDKESILEETQVNPCKTSTKSTANNMKHMFGLKCANSYGLGIKPC
jgi:hypothetical protein